MLRRSYFIVLLALPLAVLAQQPAVNDSISDSILYENVDSLLQPGSQWPVSTGNDSIIVDNANDELSFSPELHDSVYIERLKRLPSLVNLTYNNVVRNYIRAYTIRNKAKVEIMLGLQSYYFPMIEEVLDMYGLPLELKYMAVIESALNPRAVSRMGATGMWQFMLGTGRVYKLQINTFVDERRDPFLATHAAAKYLKDLYNTFNDWVLVIAAYNCGAGNVNKAIRRSGGKTSYWDIYPYLPRETRGYVPAYIGATYAMNYYGEHHITPRYVDVPPPADTVVVRKNVNLAQVSEILNIPLQQLRDLNPQYRREILPGNASPCILRLPEAYTVQFIDFQDTIYRHKANLYLSNSFKVMEPAGRAPFNRSSVAGKDKIYHTIRSGENLGSIAAYYGVNVNDLKEWNDLYSSRIIAGKKLVVYLKKPAAKPVVRSTTSAAPPPPPENTSAMGNGIVYTVKSGDTLWDIAQSYGVSDKEIMKWNNLSKTGIRPGMKLKIIQ
ncbi:MAG: LysM peptidoglycan-binding domain-containing protein [Dysgonamonadaceae bacterium]|jgi:membrane-bound lytic murein transglycosylase D|nr:LysM peptidoglycan-binding domain-containing protein [Dysgonamonadaceae bacterium]